MKKKKPPKKAVVHFRGLHYGRERMAVCSPYASDEWKITTDIEKVTCKTCRTILKQKGKIDEWD